MIEKDKFDPRKARILESEGRLKELRPQQLITDLGGVTAGMTCIDFGSGTGLFSLLMAEYAGDKGVVYAVDDSAEMLEYIRAKNPPANLRLVERDAVQTGLDNQIGDLCLLAFLLHEVHSPDILIHEVFRLLKPGGKVLVVEWKAELDSPGPSRKERISREHLKNLFNLAGLGSFEYVDWSANYYVATGRKMTAKID